MKFKDKFYTYWHGQVSSTYKVGKEEEHTND